MNDMKKQIMNKNKLAIGINIHIQINGLYIII